ncbi:hypothetical protein BJP27_24285 (plasmid) [Pseudomonas oryzihabitans]|nr:hypothetical protein BJP27_24285 [Pseudomonas psychrotolerans]
MNDVVNLNTATALEVSAAEALGLAGDFTPITVVAQLLPETIQLLQQASAETITAKALEIKTAGDLTIAADQLQRIKGMQRSIDDQRKAITKPLDDAKKLVMDYVKKPQDALTQVEGLLKAGMLACSNNLEKERRLEEAREEQRTRKAREELEARAENHEESGRTEVADALREQATMTVAAPSAVVATPKLDGIAKTKTYSTEVTNFQELVLAVAFGILADKFEDADALYVAVLKGARKAPPLAAIAPDSKFLNNQAKALKDTFNMPGVRLVTTEGLSARAK